MDEKTSDLRDLFVETTGSGTVTERQAESRGTLTDRDDAVIDERVRELVAAMRERYDFSTDLDDATYARIARGRFEKDDDEVGCDRARREARGGRGRREERGGGWLGSRTRRRPRDRRPRRAVRPPPRPRGRPRGRRRRVRLRGPEAADRRGRSIVECADALDADPDAVAKYARVARVDLTSTRANDRFRDEFRDPTDADIEGSHRRNRPQRRARRGDQRYGDRHELINGVRWRAPGERPEGARTDGIEARPPTAAAARLGRVRCGAVPGGTQRAAGEAGAGDVSTGRSERSERLKRSESVCALCRLGL